jgi:hypothetical protein
MVVTAGTVTVLGCLGIGAIVGLVPLSRLDGPSSGATENPTYYDALERSSARLVAQVDLVEAQTAKELQIGKRPRQAVR